MGKEARIQAFDIVAPANLQGQHFGVIGAKRLDKSSPTPPVTLRSTPYPTIPPVYLRPTSLSSHLTTRLPSPLPHPSTRSDSPRQFQAYFPIFLYPYHISFHPPIPLPSCPQIRLLQLPISPQFRRSAF